MKVITEKMRLTEQNRGEMNRQREGKGNSWRLVVIEWCGIKMGGKWAKQDTKVGSEWANCVGNEKNTLLRIKIVGTRLGTNK